MQASKALEDQQIEIETDIYNRSSGSGSALHLCQIRNILTSNVN